MIMSCMGCPDRKVGCHSTCQKYQEERAAHKKESDRISKLKKDEDNFDDFKIKTIYATRRHYGRK